MSIYLIRHGETELNVARIMQPAETPLSARGKAQSQSLAARMFGCGLAGVVSSHLPRAWQTASEVAWASGLQPQACELLQERNFGELRGLSYDSLGFNPLFMTQAPAGGEAALQFAQRVSAAFRFVVALRASMSGPLAVVTHGMVIRQMLLGCGICGDGLQMPSHFGNTSLSELGAVAPHQLKILNCTTHLAAENSDDGKGLSGG